MRLVKFSVSNYRSITNAHQISLGDITVLVGRNNEGKSNFLKAISLAMSIIERQSRGFFHETRDRYGRYDDKTYIWERDFPITKQINKKKEYTVFNLEFELNETEQKEFKKDIKIKANKSIPITIKLFKDNNPEIKVPKKGSSSFKNNSIKILEFISNRTNFNNIPAIRTERDTIVKKHENSPG